MALCAPQRQKSGLAEESGAGEGVESVVIESEKLRSFSMILYKRARERAREREDVS